MAYEISHKIQDRLRGGVSRQFQDNDTLVVLRRVVSNVSKSKIPGDQTHIVGEGERRDRGITCRSKTDVLDVRRHMAGGDENIVRLAWEVGIDQEPHATSLGEGVEFLLLDKFVGKFERGADVLICNAVCIAYFIKRHPAC